MNQKQANPKRTNIFKFFLLLTAVLITSLLASHQPATANHIPPDNQDDYWNTPLSQLPDNVQHHTLVSEYLNPGNNVVGFNVYTPPGYETPGNDARYHVIYVLHGSLGNENSYFGAYPNFNSLYNTRSLLSLIEGTATPSPGLTIPDAIVVFVNGGANSNYIDWAGPEHGPGSPFPIPSESIIVNELIPYIDGNFRTIPFRQGRAIEGFSMGGLGSVKFAYRYPELFCSAVVYSGAGYEHFDDEAELISNIVESNLDDIVTLGVRLRIVKGSLDTIDAEGNNELDAFLTEKGIAHEYEPNLPNTGHDWFDYYQAGGDRGLDFHQQCFLDNPPPELDEFAYLPLVTR